MKKINYLALKIKTYTCCIFLVLSVCFSFILSCASGARDDRLYTYLTDNSKFFLLHPRGIEQSMDIAQYISAEFRGQYYFFSAWVKADKNAIDIIFFNELGASMGDLSYRDGAAHFSSTVLPKSVIQSFKPEYILADFQLCFYDPLLLGKSLEASGLVLEIQDGDRRILSGNKVIIEIIKKGNTVRLENHLRGYAYTLEGDFYGNFN